MLTEGCTAGLLGALAEGVAKSVGVITLQAKAFGKMARREISAADSLGGPVEIAQQFGGHWDWPHFWTLVGALSMVLAFMNLLPIPALDGGHVLFLLYEMITRTKPSERFLENAQRVGTALILMLMFYVLIVKQVLKLVPEKSTPTTDVAPPASAKPAADTAHAGGHAPRLP